MEETHDKVAVALSKEINPYSVHSKLETLISDYAKLQKKFLAEPGKNEKEKLNKIVSDLIQLCDKHIFQVLGELHIAEKSSYNHIKPLYIASSLIELIKRYNRYKAQEVIDTQKEENLVAAALLYNIGLLKLEKKISQETHVISPAAKQALRKNYPAQSIAIMEKMGFTHPDCIEAVKNHNVVINNPSFEALLLRTPFIYAGIAMPLFNRNLGSSILNPCREFALMFSERKLDPVLGGLFLKINGLAPVGSILLFDSREKAMVIKGPDDDNISASKLRFLTNMTGLQLSKPGDIFYLHKTPLNQKGLADHHSFAWSKFAPFKMWEC